MSRFRLLAAVAPILLVALSACGAAGDGAAGGDAALARAFDTRASDLEVEGQGTVVRVLADDELGEQLHVAAGRRQFVKRRQRNQHFVADAIHVHHDLRGQRFDEFALEKSNHVLQK